MNDYNNNNRQYYTDDPSDYRGRRFRDDGSENRYGGDFDVDESVYNQNQGYGDRRYPQGYDDRPYRQYPQYPQGYDQGYQQYPQYQQDYDQGYRQYPQSYDQGYQQYPQPRQSRNVYQDDPRGYGDSYQYNNRRRVNQVRYDDGFEYRQRKAPKKRTSGVLVFVRLVAVILLIAGLGIVAYKLYSAISASMGHKELAALSHDFDQLSARNSDFFGWIKIDDTVIDYPVMYSPEEPERYLHTDFDGDYSESGELFMDADCDPEGMHYLIYGHHMHNGSMLGSIPKYAGVDYFNAHRTFRFDTLYEKGEYEVFAAFYSQIYEEGADVFTYYTCANLNDEATYNYYVENVLALSEIDAGVTPVYGEKIVTLSTCNYHTEDGRFVVCARKIA